MTYQLTGRVHLWARFQLGRLFSAACSRAEGRIPSAPYSHMIRKVIQQKETKCL